MDFSGISRRSLFGRLLRIPLRLIPDKAIVPIIQGPLRGKRWIVGASDHGCWLGSYEFSKQKVFTQHVELGHIVYDIGAHVGFYTLLSSHLVGPQGQVIAFEPLPANMEYLRRHMELNGVNNVRLYEKAVSDCCGKAMFEVARSTSMGHLSLTTPSDRSIGVEMIALDEFILKEGLPMPSIIKVDIEGGEFSFLRGARQLLRNSQPKLFIATHGDDVHQQCLLFLHELGYETASLDNRPIEATDEFLAVKKV